MSDFATLSTFTFIFKSYISVYRTLEIVPSVDYVSVVPDEGYSRNTSQSLNKIIILEMIIAKHVKISRNGHLKLALIVAFSNSVNNTHCRMGLKCYIFLSYVAGFSKFVTFCEINKWMRICLMSGKRDRKFLNVPFIFKFKFKQFIDSKPYIGVHQDNTLYIHKGR